MASILDGLAALMLTKGEAPVIKLNVIKKLMPNF